MSLADLDAISQNQRDELRGTSMGRRVTALTPERDRLVHAKLQYWIETGLYPSDELMETILREGASNV
jgi:hypothetical protein